MNMIQIIMLMLFSMGLSLRMVYALPPNDVCQGAVKLNYGESGYLGKITSDESKIEENIMALIQGISDRFEEKKGPCSFFAQSVYAALKHGISDKPTHIYRMHTKVFSSPDTGRTNSEILGSMAFRYNQTMKYDGALIDRKMVDGMTRVYLDAISNGSIGWPEYANGLYKKAGFDINRYREDVGNSINNIKSLGLYEPAIFTYQSRKKNNHDKSKGHALVLVKLSGERVVVVNNGIVKGVFKVGELERELLSYVWDGDVSKYEVYKAVVIS